MEWTVVTVIVALAGLIISVATPLVKNTKAMTELTVGIKVLNEQIKHLEEYNMDEHKDLQDQLDKHDEKITDHETRLTVIEKTGTSAHAIP